MRKRKIATRSVGASLAFSIVLSPAVAAYEGSLSEWEGSSVGGEIDIIGTRTGGNAAVTEPDSLPDQSFLIEAGGFAGDTVAQMSNGTLIIRGEKELDEFLEKTFPDAISRERYKATFVITDLVLPEAPAGGAGAAIVINPANLVTLSDVKRLVTDAGHVSISPNRAWVYVNKPVYFEADAVAHDRQLTVLGQQVTVDLTPVGYTWDAGDGSAAFDTVSPGGAWPDGEVTHTYRKARSNVSVGLTVEWSATFTVLGTTYPVAGTTIASTASAPFEIREAEAVLTG